MPNLSSYTDQELVKAYAAGDNDAFDTLLARHQNRVFAYILQNVKNRDLADDIFQETFVKAIVNIRRGSYTESGKFGAWLTTIAHNLIIDSFRQEKSENLVTTDDAQRPDVLNRADLCEGTVEDQMVTSQIMQDVRSLVELLPPSQRQVLKMRYYDNLSFKEIAAKTGVSINTSLGRMRYALINLRRIAGEKKIALTV